MNMEYTVKNESETSKEIWGGIIIALMLFGNFLLGIGSLFIPWLVWKFIIRPMF